MPALSELLRDAVGEPTVPSSFDELAREAGGRRARRRRRRIAELAAAAVLVAIAGIAVQTRSTRPQRVAIAPSTSTGASSAVTSASSGPVFSTPTGEVLIFDNGYDGITLVDLDHRVAVRRTGVGERAGDQPFRIARVGPDLLVGWGEIFAAPIAGGPSRSLGAATVYIPAVEPDRVWLVDYPNDAGTPPRAKLVMASTGAVLADVASPFGFGGSIGTGIPGGLALITTSGVDLWRLSTQRVVGHLGDPSGGQGATYDAVGSRLAWCQEDPVTFICDTLHLTDLAAAGGPTDVLTATYPGKMITGARISPDGTRVAVGTATPRDHQPGNPIQGTGDVTVEGLDIHRPVGASSDFAAMSWSPDGSRLYIKSTSSEQRTSISMWSAATDTVEHVDLPFGGLLQLVVVTADEIGALPDHAHVAADCPAVDQNSDGTRHDCAFGF